MNVVSEKQRICIKKKIMQQLWSSLKKTLKIEQSLKRRVWQHKEQLYAREKTSKNFLPFHREISKIKKVKLLEISNKALTPPPHLIGKKTIKGKMIYTRNEFCMIWVIFWMPTDQVMAFLFFISDNQSVNCLKMLFRQFQVILAHVLKPSLNNLFSWP